MTYEDTDEAQELMNEAAVKAADLDEDDDGKLGR